MFEELEKWIKDQGLVYTIFNYEHDHARNGIAKWIRISVPNTNRPTFLAVDFYTNKTEISIVYQVGRNNWRSTEPKECVAEESYIKRAILSCIEFAKTI